MKLAPPQGAAISAVVSAAMIAQQVAGKATRDALYLTSFDVTTLPWMMAAAALLSIFAAVWLSRSMLRHTPEKVVPACFAVSGLVLLAAWALALPTPRLAAVVVYLHAALFGSTVIAAFWAFVNERFDPRAGKRAVNWIAGGGTLGGMLGGLLAWRAAPLISVPTMLPLLAALNLVCLWGSLRARTAQAAGAQAPGARSPDAGSAPRISLAELSPLRIFREGPYLKNLALVVGLGAVTSGLLDYVFSAEAARVYAEGPHLLAFFAFFWLTVGVASFALQLLLGSVALEKLGLAVTVALLPGVIVLGGMLGLFLPGLASTAGLRGAEAAQRNSLFRAAYELFYTPLSEEKRRSTKLLIDVGYDRLGTVAASAIVFVTLQLQPDGERAVAILLVLCIGCALAMLTRSRPLQSGYVEVLEGSLRKEVARLEARGQAVDPAPSRESVEARDKVVEHLQELPPSAELASLAAADETKDAPLELAPPAPPDALAGLAEALGALQELCSGDPACIRRVLGSQEPLAAPLVAPAILLLASRELHPDAIRALRSVASRSTGQLTDALRDPGMLLDVRRRIPRVLSACPTQAAVDALVQAATHDERFEVRYECGRALLRITAAEPGLAVAPEAVIEIVKREVEHSKEVWDSQRELEFDEEENEPPALIDRLLRDRFDRSLEHVFSILALVLDRDSIRIAFKALHQADARLRATALEYLETVLPAEVRDAVWPFLGEERPMRPARPAHEILADLRNANGAALPRRGGAERTQRGRA